MTTFPKYFKNLYTLRNTLTSEEGGVGHEVVELVHGHRHVERLFRTGVEVTVVLGNEVNIVKHCRE